jgi:hypothetical protein
VSLWTLLELLADKKKRRALREAMREYNKNVAAGADPIEALHGHICGPNCWHQRLAKATKGSK